MGLVRANNQDSAFAGERLLLVSDGMGGHAGGDVASALCVASIAPLNNESFTTSDMLERLGDAIERARIDLVQQARAHATLSGMGTTVTGLLLCENKLAMAHMGDSRGYLLRDGKLIQVTKDHTFVQHLVDTGKITEEEAETHPQRSVVMRVLGDFELDLIPDLSIREARPGDRWLLCSDGLSGFVRFETMEQTLRDVADLELCSEYLIQLALQGGGSDNITCIVADVIDTPDEQDDDTQPSGRKQLVATAVGSVAYGDNIPDALDATGESSDSITLLKSAHERVNAVISDAIALKNGRKVEEPTTATGSLALGNPTRKVAPINDDDDLPVAVTEPPAKKRRVGRAIFNTFLVLLLLGGAGYGAYHWGSHQYFIGVHDGKIAIFNGFPQSVGPVNLSSTVEVSNIDPDDLDPYAKNQVYSTIRASSLDNAQDRIEEFRIEIEQRKAEEAAALAEKEAAAQAAEEAARKAEEEKAAQEAAAQAEKEKAQPEAESKTSSGGN